VIRQSVCLLNGIKTPVMARKVLCPSAKRYRDDTYGDNCLTAQNNLSITNEGMRRRRRKKTQQLITLTKITKAALLKM